MIAEPSLLSYFTGAGPVVKLVMLLLLAASVLSWTYIFQRAKLLKEAKKSLQEFEQAFWAQSDLQQLYKRIDRDPNRQGTAAIFHAAMQEYNQAHHNGLVKHKEHLLDALKRQMRIATSKELDKLEHHLSFLASVGSTSPYIGLFGTVWGIMTAFQALGNVQQATIAMVAPGISEALVATAMGLFAAIPAVLAYNRFSAGIEQFGYQFDTFQDELFNVINKEVYTG